MNETAICPVSKEQIDVLEAKEDGLERIVDGKTYYLCCHHCAADFDADPKEFINEVDEP